MKTDSAAVLQPFESLQHTSSALFSHLRVASLLSVTDGWSPAHETVVFVGRVIAALPSI